MSNDASRSCLCSLQKASRPSREACQQAMYNTVWAGLVELELRQLARPEIGPRQACAAELKARARLQEERCTDRPLTSESQEIYSNASDKMPDAQRCGHALADNAYPIVCRRKSTEALSSHGSHFYDESLHDAIVRIPKCGPSACHLQQPVPLNS